MNVIIVDTSVWISFFKGAPFRTLDLALKEGRAYITPIVVSELLSGFRPESKRHEFVQFLKELPLCDASFEHWVRTGDLRLALGRQGFTISTTDAHIAQCTLDLDAYLLTEDKIFSKISKSSGLKLAEAE